MNPIVAIIAVYAAAKALQMQSKEFKHLKNEIVEQRKEIKKQREEFEKQRVDSMFFHALETLEKMKNDFN